MIWIALLLILAAGCAPTAPAEPLTLHYDRPAEYFEEALPLGNGRLGAMVYGNPFCEHVSLNDITLWTGEPDRGAEHPDLQKTGLDGDGSEALKAIREALEQEDYKLADALQRRLQGHYSETYMPLGTLHFSYDSCAVSAYSRTLDISTASASVSYERDGVPFRADYFISAPDSVMVVQLTSESPFTVRISMGSQLPHETTCEKDGIVMDGYAAWHAYPGYYDYKELADSRYLYDPERGIHFRTRLAVLAQGGSINHADSTLILNNINGATLYLANATSFNGPFRDPVLEGKPYRKLADAQISNALRKGPDKLRRRQLKDYRSLFDRVTLDLGATADSIKCLPTDVQLQRYTELEESNPELEALYFQYGRYLLISCSRTDGVPANLQGLWNESINPPWSSNYTININLEENYWPAEAAALPEMHESLLGFLHALSANGEPVAKRMYGASRGWNAGHNTDIWAMATPVGLGVGDPDWANWTMGGAWLATHIWEHWLFTRDRDDLKRDYPVLKGAAEFCLDWLIEKDGELITSPGTSPENYYVTSEGYFGATLYGATADLAIIRECVGDAVAAARELGVDEDFIREASTAMERLHPYRISEDGRLQEWYHDWKDLSPKHRHQSHLIGVYPGHQISDGPLADAALKTLETKGFNTTGWSCGWRINLYARLGEGELAYKMFRRLLRYVSPDNYKGPDAKRGGGTYPNLLDAHSPFQIDGNFGGCAGIMGMLLQSTADSVTPLPALPQAWKSGSVRGLRTRRGTAVDISWKDGRVTAFKEIPGRSPE